MPPAPALELELIDDAVNGALIVVALITTALAPPVFSRLLGPFADEAHKRAILIAAGDTGGEIAPRLRAAGMEVTAIDTDEQALRSLAEVGCLTIVGDATNRRILAQANLDGAEVAVIAVSDRERTVEVARGLREANNRLRIITWVAGPIRASRRWRSTPTGGRWPTRPRSLVPFCVRASSMPSLTPTPDLGETVLTNDALDGAVISEMGIPAGVRILLITREGSALVPEGSATA